MKNSLLKLCFFAPLLLFYSCHLDELDFSKLSHGANLKPEMVVPVAKATISVWDLMQAANKDHEEGLTKDPNGLIKIVYKQNELFQFKGRDLIQFPVKNNFSTGDKVLGNILVKDITLSTNIALNDLVNKTNGALNGILLMNGKTLPFPPISVAGFAIPFSLEEVENFKSITLGKGRLEITMKNNLKVPLSIHGSFFDIGDNSEIKAFSFMNVAPNETKTISMDVTGVQLSNQLEFRLLSFDTPGSALPVNINLSDYFKLTFHLVDLGISSGKLMIDKSNLIEGSGGEFEFSLAKSDPKAFSGILNKGSVSITSSNNSQMTGSIHFILTELKKDGLPVEIDIPLGGNSTTIDLSGATMNFSADPAFPYNRIPYVYSIAVNSTNGFIDYSSMDMINMDLSLNDIEFKSYLGDFGKQSLKIDAGHFNMKVDLLNKIEGLFKLANPALVLTIHNSIGIPASVELDLKATNKSGQSVVLKREPSAFDLFIPESIDQGMATGNIAYNKQSSNIVDFISLPPTGDIEYSGEINFNKFNPVTTQKPNFMDMDSKLVIDLGLELPMELQVNQLGFKDTSKISGSDYNKVESVDLIINALNGIPLDIDLQLLFVDTISKVQYGASQMSKILSAAKVNTTGEITPVQSLQTFTLNPVEMRNLRKANGLVLSGKISSPDLGKTVAPIYSDSEIKLNVVVKTKVNL